VFEDLHWAEPTLLDLIESLAVKPGRSPILLVCIGRPELLEQRPAWGADTGRAQCIELAPLGQKAAAAMVDALAGDQPVPASIRAQLIETAGGNPLYLEQLAVSLSEQTESALRPVLPPTIQALLAARLQRLGPGAGSVLSRAAIIGKHFGVQAVQELLPPEARAPVGRNLQTLIAKGLVQQGPPGTRAAEEYRFRHILIQQAAYRAIPKSLRAELHQRFADWLEYAWAGPLPQRAEILGYHLEQSVHYRQELRPAEAPAAGLSRRAAAHLERAGSAAYARGDALAALNLLDRAAALLPPGDPAAGRLCTSLGAVLTEAGRLDQARAALDRAQRITAEEGDENQHAHARAQALWLRLEIDQDNAVAEIGRALQDLRDVFGRHQDDLGICRALQLEAALHWNHARSAAAEDAWQRAAGYARSLNDRPQLTDILGWLASAALWGPTPVSEGIRRCKGYLEEIGNHSPGRAVILLHLAGLYAMQDDITAAHATLSRARALLEAVGPTLTAAITQPAALIAMLAGDPAAAETHLRREYESLSAMGERRYLATTAVKLARAVAAQGQSRYDEATELIATSREAAAGADQSADAVGQAILARVLADRGRHGEAVKLARSAAALTAETDLLSERADILLDLAHVLAAAGRGPEAHTAAGEALDLYQHKGNQPGARESLRCLAQYAPA
jgi:tetratricopeptide (TPR) repeat protein